MTTVAEDTAKKLDKPATESAIDDLEGSPFRLTFQEATPAERLIIIAGVLVACILSQLYLKSHFWAVDDIAPAPLLHPLKTLPKELGKGENHWVGVDTPIRSDYLYADEHLQRTYQNQSRKHQSVSLWMAYSESSEDRKHHPEVCMEVAGLPEDRNARREITVPGHEAKIQQYRFGRTGKYQYVYYWHYTLPSEKSNEMDGLQRLYQSVRRLPASLTIEVFAPESASDDPQFAQEFVRMVDAAVQAHVGPTAVRGSERTPVTILEAEG